MYLNQQIMQISVDFCYTRNRSFQTRRVSVFSPPCHCRSCPWFGSHAASRHCACPGVTAILCRCPIEPPCLSGRGIFESTGHHLGVQRRCLTARQECESGGGGEDH